jgi:hypothetical protein
VENGVRENPKLTRELEKVRQSPCLFERIEVWSRSGDPMAVGVIGGERPRYFSIARWGDARVTLEQVKKRLRMEEWVLRLVPIAGYLVIFLIARLGLTLIPA